jgi:hypothetical protein
VISTSIDSLPCWVLLGLGISSNLILVLALGYLCGRLGR